MPTTDIYAGIYVKDVNKIAFLFQQLFGATIRPLQPDMVEVNVGTGRLILNQRNMLGGSALSGPGAQYLPATNEELELGICVNDIEQVHKRVESLANSSQNTIDFVSRIVEQDSGRCDFRFRLREGYYIRISGEA